MAENENKKIGAVAVIGGGIAAMQSAIDLADSGFLVYLVTDRPSIGGNMVRLDKTFPTNDCSMCIVSPKLSTVGNHPNIRIITMADVESFDGRPGDFRLRLKKRSRFIDEKLCTGCADCETVCPVHLPNEQNEGLDDRRATYRMYPQAVPNWFAIDRKATAPCKVACPAHISAQGYVNLVAEGRFRDALDTIRMRIPFPSVCGRICYHPCEDECIRGEVDEPVAINNLKRFVADLELEEAGLVEGFSGIELAKDASKQPGVDELKDIEPREEKVAVIGAGPSGLTAAHDLAQLGFKVTVFEALPVAGGMLAVGIPDYRLPKRIFNHEIDRIKALGVEIRLNTPVKRDGGIDKLFESGYSAVYIASGAHKSYVMNIPGETLPGVSYGLDFLRRVNAGERPDVGRYVVVIGGGNSAIDAARTSLRLGAERVMVVYRRSRAEMPAHEWEIGEAEREGVEFVFLASPVEIFAGADGKADRIRFIRNELGEPDAGGRASFKAVPGTEFDLDVDTVVAAIGHSPETSFIAPESGVKLGRWDNVDIEDKTSATSRKGVFAGGDCVTGPATAIQAIAAGKNAAVSIARFLLGEDMGAPRHEDYMPPAAVADEKKLSKIPNAARTVNATLDREKRRAGFAEVEKPYTPEQAMAEAARCLKCGVCSDCRQCELVCKQHAVNFDMTDENVEVPVGAVILSPGFEPYDPRPLTQFGYGLFSNVYTSIEFERLLSASGPTFGHIQRRSDGAAPKRIAFIQCVGSRDCTINAGYCSSVCCMYTAKEAVIAKEHDPALACSVFCIDERAHGKHFDRYVERARNEGVRYIRSSVSGIKELQRTKSLLISFIDDSGKQAEEEFDMAVLAVGMKPTSSAAELSDKFGAALNDFGFCATAELEAVRTSREGVFVAGAWQSPKDIPDSVTQGGAAACEAMSILAEARGTCIEPEVFPPEKDIAKEQPRIGVLVCRCGFNIGSVVDVPAVVEFAKTLPGVVHAEETLYSCSQDSLAHIVDIIRENGLNRLVISSCTVRTHLPLFEQTVRRAGLNKYLVEMANIREQDSWVHKNSPALATEKAKALVAGAAAKVGANRQLPAFMSEVTPRALIIGGGPAGMTAALAIAEQGFEAIVVEKESHLGGNMRRIRRTPGGADAQAELAALIEKVKDNRLIKIYESSVLTGVSGHVGKYETTIAGHNGEVIKIQHGVIIVSTGGRELRPELSFSEHPAVMTQTDLENLIEDDVSMLTAASNIVMVQCHGSRNEEHPWCSRYCCSQAVKNALSIKKINPHANVYVLYRDVRTYGFKELEFQKAREAGVVFIRFRDGDDPLIANDGEKVRVSVTDDVLKRDFIFEPDILALSVAALPAEANAQLFDMLKLPLDSDGFFQEAHAKLRPVDFPGEGIFLCGLAHSPKPLEENIIQAKAAAARAASILSKDMLEVPGVVAVVDEDRCAACLTCVRVCPFGVPKINESGKAEIKGVECQGCGCCASECPAKAIQVEHFRDEQLVAQQCAVVTQAKVR